MAQVPRCCDGVVASGAVADVHDHRVLHAADHREDHRERFPLLGDRAFPRCPWRDGHCRLLRRIRLDATNHQRNRRGARFPTHQVEVPRSGAARGSAHRDRSGATTGPRLDGPHPGAEGSDDQLQSEAAHRVAAGSVGRSDS